MEPVLEGYSIEFTLLHDGVPTCAKKTLSLEGLTPLAVYSGQYWSDKAGSDGELDALKLVRQLLRDACALDGWDLDSFIRAAKGREL